MSLPMFLDYAPMFSMAHTAWFAHGQIQPYVSFEATSIYLSVLTLIALCLVLVGVYCERRGVLLFSFLCPKGSKAFDHYASTFSMVTGAFLVIAGTHSYLFSPNITPETGIPLFLIYAQILVGLSCLVGVFARVAALGLLFIWVAAFSFVPALLLIENIWVVSTALFIFIMGNDYFSAVPFRLCAPYVTRFKSYALPLLRLGTGATLLILGFSEKILRPELGMHFLETHAWNFMQSLGIPWYTDYLFTLSAGAVESLFGLMFILGIVTRLNALVLTIFFTIPMFFLGPIELAGHLPHFAAVLLLLLFGPGEHFTLRNVLHDKSPRRPKKASLTRA